MIITILEGEEDHWWGDDDRRTMMSSSDWGMVIVLSGCITVASAAIADAGIDCVDMVSGGVAAIVKDKQNSSLLVLDPIPSEHEEILAMCVVAYIPSRDEITNLWIKGDIGHKSSTTTVDTTFEGLTDSAVQAALGSYRILVAALKETADIKMNLS